MSLVEQKSADAALQVKGVSLSYGDFTVLREVTFEAPHGQALVVMGGSGCGKSTLLKSLIGLLEPVTGSVRYGKNDFWAIDEGARETLMRRFGILYQGGALWSSMSLLENVSLPLETYTDLSASEVREATETCNTIIVTPTAIIRSLMGLLPVSWIDFPKTGNPAGEKRDAGLPSTGEEMHTACQNGVPQHVEFFRPGNPSQHNNLPFLAHRKTPGRRGISARGESIAVSQTRVRTWSD